MSEPRKDADLVDAQERLKRLVRAERDQRLRRLGMEVDIKRRQSR